jgi:hypothetical protein
MEINSISKFKQEDKLYVDFYKDDNYYIDIHYVYVNRNNEIVKIRREPFIMTTPNTICRDELIGIFKRNSTDDSVPYSILSILKYNITVNPEDVVGFIKDSEHTNFLSTINNIDDIRIERTISMFQDLNDLLFVFYEKNSVSEKSKSNATKKVYIYETNKHRKTIRKQYKG